jgi:NAD(P)-dependent dehydrogenase (short-subunit alcohol dehydrogenase family)
MGVHCLSLEGKIAVVTGSKTGMGRAIALLFAEAGADLALCSRVTTDGQLQTVAEKVRKLGRRSLAMQVDIRDKTAVNNFVQKVSDELGEIDIWVNVAGVLNISPLVDLPEEDWDRVLDTDLKGYYLCCQAVGKRMIKNKKGCIINIASTDAFNPIPYQVAYNCAKTGVPMLTSVLAFELGRYNIRVNCIAPGWVKTKMTEYFDTNPAALKAAEDEVALGRIGEPSEIANVALFLASDLASYVSGATWRVDGAQNPTSLAAAPEQM